MNHQITLNQLLISHYAPTFLEVIDESHKHAGHAGVADAQPGASTHLRVRISASSLPGNTRLHKHQAINRLAEPLFTDGLHALAIELV